MNEIQARNKATRTLLALLKRDGISYKELAERLVANGYETTTNAIRVKMHRGSFSAGFLLAVCEALNRQNFNWKDE